MEQKQIMSRSDKNDGKAKLDSLDYQILRFLQDDCRLSFSKVAAKANVSVGTAYNRIKHFENAGLVKGYTILVDPLKLGCELTAVIFVQVEGENLYSVENLIAKKENVLAVYDVTGEFDAAVIAKFKDRVDLSGFIKHLAALPHVKRTITTVSLNTVKEDFRISLQ